MESDGGTSGIMAKDSIREKNIRIGIGLAIFIVLLGALALTYGILV